MSKAKRGKETIIANPRPKGIVFRGGEARDLVGRRLLQGLIGLPTAPEGGQQFSAFR
jgi:hypothetical protein